MQFRQALQNVLTVLSQAQCGSEHIVRMTWYIKDIEAYRRSLKEIGTHYQALMHYHFPAMTVVEVSNLVEPKAKIEIEATAWLPAHTA